jgi:hypothetical protein
VDLFIEKFKVSFRENVTDTMAKTEGFLEWYLDTVLRDTPRWLDLNPFAGLWAWPT